MTVLSVNRPKILTHVGLHDLYSTFCQVSVVHVCIGLGVFYDYCLQAPASPYFWSKGIGRPVRPFAGTNILVSGYRWSHCETTMFLPWSRIKLG